MWELQTLSALDTEKRGVESHVASDMPDLYLRVRRAYLGVRKMRQSRDVSCNVVLKVRFEGKPARLAYI